MNILTNWLHAYLPTIPVDDKQLAEDLTHRGIAVEGTFPVEGGTRFEMDITTNRVDAMNHYGIAREAAAIYNLPLPALNTEIDLSSRPDPEQAKRAEGAAEGPAVAFPVRVDAPELCGRFTAQVIRNVTIGESKGDIATYFDALGQKKISNAVDASNFVLQGMGQPTHAFDLDKIEGGIVVRGAHKNEKIKLLDGTERTLVGDELVVADEKKALALAGVMGGWDSMITHETKNILVEAAWFDPASIRRSSRRHLLHTDASHRFERGADFNAAPIGNALVSQLILMQCGGTLEGEMIDIIVPEAQAKTANRAPISLAVQEVKRHLGTTIAAQQGQEGLNAKTIEQYLTALGCKLSPADEEKYSVTLPSWRLDLEREIDLIEEIARVYGYNNFANTLPTPGTVIAQPNADKADTVRNRMLALGFTEAISSTFCSAADAELFAPRPNTSVAMGNPLSEEAGMLRPSLLPGILAALAHNLNRDIPDVRLFETGTAFEGSTKQVNERQALAFGITGTASPSPLYPAKDVLFYEMKGAIEDLLTKFDGMLTFTTEGLAPYLHPGRAADIYLNGKPVGCFGELHPAEAQKRKLKQAVYIGEICLQTLFTHALRQPVSHELSRYQAVERDFSFIFADTITWSAIMEAIDALKLPELVSVTPIEIFRDAKGKAVPAGHYSVLLRTVFQSSEATLREEELSYCSNSVIAALSELDGKLRG